MILELLLWALPSAAAGVFGTLWWQTRTRPEAPAVPSPRVLQRAARIEALKAARKASRAERRGQA